MFVPDVELQIRGVFSSGTGFYQPRGSLAHAASGAILMGQRGGFDSGHRKFCPRCIGS